MPVPMLDLVAQYAQLRDEIEPAVAEIFEAQWFRGGPKVEAFEKAMADYCGVPDAVGVASGTDALLLALKTLDLQPGDEIITTTFTFFATAGAIANAGGIPVFVDIDPATYNIDPDQIEIKITERTRAIVPVHLYGQCADMDSILALAKRHDLKVIEDAAQSIGAKYKGRSAGSMSDPGAALSFYPTKSLGGAGEGGMVLARDEGVAEEIRLLRCHGSEVLYHHSIIGTNSHLGAIQAAVLHVKLKYLEEWTNKRRANAHYYDAHLGALEEIVTPHEAEGNLHVYSPYVIRIPKRDEAMAFLREREIGCAVFYPLPLHRQECFEHWGGKDEVCPEANRASKEVLALPIYPELTQEQLEEVVETVKAFIAQS